METDLGKEELKISWDMGTAYDFFASLKVLHYPAKFGVRGAWAAGVRSRLSQNERDFLEDVVELFSLPFIWVYNLPGSKDTDTVLYTIKQIPAAERLPTVLLSPLSDPLYVERLKKVSARSSWNEEDQDFVISRLRDKHKDNKYFFSPKRVEKLLDYFADAEGFGRNYLGVLQSYNEVFFAEEEKRIAPKIDEAFISAQKSAKELPLLKLLEELSRGLKFEELPGVEELILVPTYWLSPLITTEEIDDHRRMLLFGARPPGESLVPGEIVPEDLLQILKALADPTRLRILRYLMQEQLTPAKLSRRLRLRAPTVTHHLHTLRLAGLVRFVMRGKHGHLYFARMESIKSSYALLKDFLEQDVVEVERVDALDRDRIY